MLGISTDMLMVVIPALVFGYVYGRTTLRMQLRIGKEHKQLEAMRAKIQRRLGEKTTKRREIKAQLNKKMLSAHPKTRRHDDGKDFERANGLGTLNAWAESNIPGVPVLSTMCELTDEIFAAADRAGIVPDEFFKELESKGERE